MLIEDAAPAEPFLEESLGVPRLEALPFESRLLSIGLLAVLL